MRRAKTIWAAFWFAFLLCLAASAPSPAEEPIGRVEWVKGRLALIHQGRRSFARAGQLLYEGDRLETGLFSRAALLLDGHRLEMGPGSELLLVEVRRPERYRLFLWLGRLWLAVQDRLGLDFRVETPAAIAGVRGTVFAVAVAGDGTTVVGVEEGSVVVSMPSGEAEVEVPAGWEVTVRPGAPPEPPRKAAGGHGEEGNLQGEKGAGPKGEGQGQGPQGGGGK
ncbi:MAG: FecR family protein [Firmicutes bacterium]|nr:FecR family protein [Bacillota bacterium]